MDAIKGYVDLASAYVHQVPTPVQWALAGVGALFVGAKVLSYLSLVLKLFVLPGTNLRKYGPKGTWAVVTGASDGLGKEYAQQLAAKGFNLVLVSRTESKLKTLARELELRWSGHQNKILAIDYASATDADFDRLAEAVAGLDIGILINNVGQSHSIPTSFLDTTVDELSNIITINCLGTLRTTKIIAPMLVERKKKGLILTMGSMGGWSPTPYLATYSGSKAFLQQWSTALAQELKPSGVDVYLVLSYLVTSAMSKVRRPTMMIPNAKTFVKAALAKVGNVNGSIAHTYTPYWAHAIFQWALENTLGVGHPLVVKINMDNHVDIRRRAIRKAEREAKKA